MADNYLENKFDQLQKARKVVVKRNNPSLDTLLHKNRSHRGYDKSRVVTEDELRKIVAVNPLLPSGMNRQALRFKLVTRDTGAEKVLRRIRLGGALPELHLPLPGTEPEAFILVCATVPEDRIVDIDETRRNIQFGEQLPHDGIRTAIKRIRSDHMVTGLYQRKERRVDRRHARTGALARRPEMTGT